MTGKSTSPALTRRSFAKGALAATTVAALAGALGTTKVNRAFAEEAKPNAANEGRTDEVFGHCRMCMMCGSCSFVATTKDGVVVNVEGDPDRKTNAGGLCPRGKSSITNLYNPYRIKAPMKRTNPEKGMEVDPGWVEISWDEALGLAAEQLGQAYLTDPRSIVHCYSFSAYESSHATLGQGVWAKLMGIPNVTSVKGQMCAIHYGAMYMIDGAPSGNYDGKYDEYVVVMGKSLGYDNGYAGGDARTFADVCRRGGKFVVVGPRATMEATRGEWVSCKIGTELALVYAWINEMVNVMDAGFDADYVKRRTNGVYLIGPDGDYVRDAAGKPLIWDAAANAAKAFDDATLTDPALEGSYTVEGVACRPAFALLQEAVADYTPEWASEITTVPAERIRGIAHELVEHAHIGSTIEIDGEVLPYRPACVVLGRGCTNQQTGTLIDLWSRVINLLLGNVGYPGGLQSTLDSGYFHNLEGTVEPFAEAVTLTEPPTWPPTHLDLSDYYPHMHSLQTHIWHVMADPERYGIDYRPSLYFSSGANPVAGSDDAELVMDGLRKFDFVIYHGCYHMDEMAMMSDLLLPENANLEGTSVHLFPGNECSSTACNEGYNESNHAIVVRQGVQPLYNTMEGNDILMGIFARMGQGSAWNTIANTLGSIGFVMMNAAATQLPVPEELRQQVYYPLGGVPFMNEEIKLDPEKNYTSEEMWDLNLKSALGPDKGLDFLKEVKFIPFTAVSGAELYAAHRDPEVRFQLYPVSQMRSGKVLVDALETFPVDMGELLGTPLDVLRHRFDPVPYYPTDLVIDNEPEEYDLRSFLYRQPLFMFRLASMDQDPIRRDYAEKYLLDDNAVLINPDTAAARGIAENDRVHVESPYGETWGRAHLTQTVRPDALGIGGCRGRKTSRMGADLLNDTNYNDLLCGAPGHTEPIDGGELIHVSVKVSKA